MQEALFQTDDAQGRAEAASRLLLAGGAGRHDPVPFFDGPIKVLCSCGRFPAPTSTTVDDAYHAHRAHQLARAAAFGIAL